MTNTEAINVLTRHVRECGMFMPIEWVQEHGDDSDFMKAMELAIKALRDSKDVDE